MSTDLHFCNFCQQSVPADKLDTGDAVRHGGRVVCPTCCDTLMLATASRTEVVKPPSLIVPLVVGFVGWGLAAFAWFSHDQYSRNHETELTDSRINTDQAIGKIIADHQALETELRESDSSMAEAIEDLTIDAEATKAGNAEAFAALNTAVEPVPGLQDNQELTAGNVEALTTRLGLAEESLQKVRTDQEFLRDEMDNMARIAATAGPPAPQEGDFSEEIMELLAKLEHDDSMVRYEGLEALGRFDDVRLAEYVEPCLDDGYEMNRFYAAYALGEMRSLDTCPSLIQLLDDDYAFVRKAAYEALQKISGQDIPFDHKATDRAASITEWENWWKGQGGESAATGG